MLTRRNLLVGATAGAVTSVLWRYLGGGVARAAPAAQGPRYWIQVLPLGGVDAIMTTDPRTPKAVLEGVHLPYPTKDIVEAKGMQLGPHFKALAPWSAKIAIVNGVRVETANHETGTEHITRLRTRTTPRSNAVFEVLAAHRSGQAVGAVAIGTALPTAFTPNFFGQPSPDVLGTKNDLFAALAEMSPEDFTLAAKTLRKLADSARRSGASTVRERRRLSSLEDGARLFERLVDTPKLQLVPWHKGPDAPYELVVGHSENMQRALWLIENDLASSVAVHSVYAWDSHFDTERRQAELNPTFAANLVRLFQELESRSNKYGKLSDQTGVIVGSEIGRYPYLNLSKGKDHFPQIPMLFYGKCFTTGTVYGDCDKELNSRPVSIATGRPDPNGHRIVLDDVGATVLRLAGLDPEVHGFDGKNLDFLVKR